MAKVDWDAIRHALEIARANGYAEVTIADGDTEFEATLEAAPKKRSAPTAVKSEAPAEPALLDITATLVGYFQSGKQPLEIGRKVAKGDVIGGVKALGLATDVESAVSGEIVEVLVKDGEAVMFGQSLAKVKP